MHRLLLAVLALASAAPALAQTEPGAPTPAPDGVYYFRAARDTSIIYLRLPDPPRSGPTAKAWKMIYLRQPVGSGDQLTQYGAVLDEFDCETPRVRTLASTAFGPDNRLVASKSISEDWSPIAPNSNAEYDRTLVCTGKPLADDDRTTPLAGRAAWQADARARL